MVGATGRYTMDGDGGPRRPECSGAGGAARPRCLYQHPGLDASLGSNARGMYTSCMGVSGELDAGGSLWSGPPSCT